MRNKKWENCPVQREDVYNPQMLGMIPSSVPRQKKQKQKTRAIKILGGGGYINVGVAVMLDDVIS